MASSQSQDAAFRLAMRCVSEALQLDGAGKTKEAYKLYLQNVQQISQNLLYENEKGDVPIVTAKKMVKLASKCIERVEALLGDMPVNSSISHSPVTASGSPMLVKGPISPAVGPTTQALRRQPLEMAQRQNQQLMTAYRARMSKMRLGRQQATDLSLTVQRKLVENMAIAKARQEALQKKLQERHLRLEKEAERRFSSTTGMSKDELERRQIYTRILEYEHDVTWLLPWRNKLKQNPEDETTIQDLIRSVLRTKDHPLTQLLLKYQHVIYDKVQPLLADFYRKMALHKTESTSGGSRTPDSPVICPERKDISGSEASGAGTPQDVASRAATGYSIPDFDDLFEDEDFSTESSKGGDTIIEAEGRAHVTGGEGLNHEGQGSKVNSPQDKPIDDPSACSHPVRVDSATSSVSESDLGVRPADCNNIPDSSLSPDDPGTQAAATGNSLDNGLVSDDFEKLEVKALERHLVNIVQDVQECLERLLAMWIVAYEALDSPAGRDLAYATLEEPFFSPVWGHLVALYRVCNRKREETIAQVMFANRKSSPADVRVTRKFCLHPEDAPLMPEGKYSAPYGEAIRELQAVPAFTSPLSKLEALVRVSKCVCQSVEEFYANSDQVPCIGADDLLPILSYVILKCDTPQIVSECRALEDLVHEGYLMGEEGYCLTSIQTALSYIHSLGKANPS